MLWRDAAKATACLVAWLVVLEGGLEICDAKLQIERWGARPIVGWTFLPKAQGWCVYERPNYIRFNSAGYDDAERATVPAKGVIRIAVVGDSYTAAVQVAREKRFTEILQRDLGAGYEVMNFGVDAYALGQEFLTMRDILPAYHPHIVIALVTFANGIYYSSREMGERLPNTPFFRLAAEHDGLILEPTPVTVQDAEKRNQTLLLWNRFRWIALGKAGWAALGDVWARWQRRAGLSTRHAGLMDAPERLTEWPYCSEATLYTARAWKLSEALLRAMYRTAREREIRFLVVSADLPMQADPDARRSDAFRRSLGLRTLTEPNERLAKFTEANAIEYLDLTPAMAEYAARTGTAVHGFEADVNDGHWNERGHAVAGRAIYEWLGRAGIARLPTAWSKTTRYAY